MCCSAADDRPCLVGRTEIAQVDNVTGGAAEIDGTRIDRRCCFRQTAGSHAAIGGRVMPPSDQRSATDDSQEVGPHAARVVAMLPVKVLSGEIDVGG